MVRGRHPDIVRNGKVIVRRFGPKRDIGPVTQAQVSPDGMLERIQIRFHFTGQIHVPAHRESRIANIAYFQILAKIRVLCNVSNKFVLSGTRLAGHIKVPCPNSVVGVKSSANAGGAARLNSVTAQGNVTRNNKVSLQVNRV